MFKPPIIPIIASFAIWFFLFYLIGLSMAAASFEFPYGPYRADVLSVYDGGTR